MQIAEQIDKHQLRELLSKGWLTHDAIWFYNVIKEIGIDKANIINLNSIEAMAAIEIQRYLKALGYQKDTKFTRFQDFVEFFDSGFSILKADFMDFKYDISNHNLIYWKWNSCFAYNGMSQFGLIDHYQCGVIHRIETWFKTLGIKNTLEPKIKGCLMHTQGSCEGKFCFYFDE